jgi:hypothetical protein
MPNGWAGTAETPEHLNKLLSDRLRILQHELGETVGVVPLGLILVVDEAHGGDSTAKEIVNRFHLLDRESGNIIDFYYLGWRTRKRGDLLFDLDLFSSWRKELKRVGVKHFGGNADLILVDLQISPEGCTLRFDNAIYIDLAKRVKTGDFPTLGEFLQAVVSTAEEARSLTTGNEASPVFRISDQLGVLFAKESLLDFILDKFGKFLGARRLSAMTVRNLGPRVALADFRELSK